MTFNTLDSGVNRSVFLVILGSRRLGWSFDRHFQFGARLEAHFLAILVGQSIFDPNLSI
jgi:hypothetical protein